MTGMRSTYNAGSADAAAFLHRDRRRGEDAEHRDRERREELRAEEHERDPAHQEQGSAGCPYGAPGGVAEQRPPGPPRLPEGGGPQHGHGTRDEGEDADG